MNLATERKRCVYQEITERPSLKLPNCFKSDSFCRSPYSNIPPRKQASIQVCYQIRFETRYLTWNAIKNIIANMATTFELKLVKIGRSGSLPYPLIPIIQNFSHICGTINLKEESKN